MQKKSMQDVPPELLVQIFSFFTPRELCQVIAPVCQSWWLLSKTKSLWLELKLPNAMLRSKEVYCGLFRRCSSLDTLYIWSKPQFQALVECSKELPHLKNLTFHCINTISVTKLIIYMLVLWFPQLEMLCLKGEIIDDFNAVSGFIVHLKNLRSLTVDSKNLDDKFIARIAKYCHKLQRLMIRSTLITDNALKALSKYRSETLLGLNLFCNSLTDMSLVALSSCTKLRTLELSYGYAFTDVGLQALCNLACLVELKLFRCTGATENGWALFFLNLTLTNLKTLELTGLKIDDVGLQIAAKSANKNLQHLSISECSKISDKGLEVAIDNCSSLNTLKLWGLVGVTGEGLVQIPSKLQNLEFLDLQYCQNVIPEVVYKLGTGVQGMRRARFSYMF